MLLVFTIIKKRSELISCLKSRRIIPYLLIAVLSIFHLIFTRTNHTFWGNLYRHQGIFLLWHLLTLGIIAPLFKGRIPKIIPITCIIILVYSAFMLGPDQNHRFIGTLGEPNALAAAAIFIWPFIFFPQNTNLYIKLSAASIALLIIIISQSKSGLIAFSLQLTFLFLLQKTSFKKALIFSLLFLTVSLSLPYGQKDLQYQNRFRVWKTAIVGGFFNPLTGSGFGNIEETINRASLLLNNSLTAERVDSAHNLFLDWFIQGGIPGIAIITYLITKTFQNLVIKKLLLEIVLLLGVLTVMLFNPSSIATLIAFWWIVGRGLKLKSPS